MQPLQRSPGYISLKDQIPEEPPSPLSPSDSDVIDLTEALKITPNEIKDNKEKRIKQVAKVLDKPK